MTPAPLAASPYRAAVVPRRTEGPPRRPPWRAAALVSALVAGAASSRETAARHGVGDDPRAGAPVEHARLLAGGDGLCALTAMRDGTHQVVCAEADEVSHGLDRRRVSHAWRSPPLARLVSCGGGDTVAAGLTADGRVVRFARGGAEATPWALPSLAPHGPITAVACDVLALNVAFLIATTRDGAVLRLESWSDVAAPAPARTELFPADTRGTRLIPRRHENPCAVRADGVWCVPFDTVGGRVPAERVFAGSSWVDAAYGAGWLCARDRAGRVACAGHVRSDEGWSLGRPAALEGAPLQVEALAGSMGDLCVRGGADRWWCAEGPSRDAPTPWNEVRLAVHPEPLLDGAVEVALGEGSGCARWPDGDVRCWGRHLRGGSFEARGPVEIPAARDAAVVSVDDVGACALRRGEVWCWGGFGTVRPRRVGLSGDARALDVPYVAVGTTVYLLQYDGRALALPNPRGDDAAVESLAHGWNSVCARRADGRVTCWHREEDGDDGGPPTLRYVPERVAALEGYARFAASHDRVCAWDRGRAGRCWGHEVVAPPRAIAFTRWRVRDVHAHDLDAPDRLDGRCAVYPDGHRDCYAGAAVESLLGVAVPDWALDPEGDFARLRRRDEARCAVLPDRRVACRIDHDGESPRSPYRLTYWRVIPGVHDVRALSAARRYDPYGYGDWFACAIQRDGRVFCWGTNVDDALSVGDSDGAPPLVPLRR